MLKEWIQSALGNKSPAETYWWITKAAVGDGGIAGAWFPTYTTISLLFILLCHFARSLYSSIIAARVPPKPSLSVSANRPLRTAEIISDSDLKSLMECLDEKLSENEKWENVIDRKRDNLYYTAKCCKPKGGPLKYLSVTVFENCSAELLRDFYMDNDYRKLWDKMVVSHEQLQVDETNGTEIGRTVKKFPLLTHREYVLAWKLWEGKDKTFYCFIKECEHPLAPKWKNYVRVGFFRSGWRIRKVPGKDACEIKMVHQEDAGLNVEMAKMAFAKGIWSYVCKMDTALRGFAAFNLSHQSSEVTAVTLMKKVPPGFETDDNLANQTRPATSAATTLCGQVTGEASEKASLRRPSKKVIAHGLLLVGGIVCLSRARSSLGAKVVTAYILKKLTNHAPQTTKSRIS